ncbi:hypothetical protein MBLNU459_g6639t1 [Dothideomycetes sp. NU459]
MRSFKPSVTMLGLRARSRPAATLVRLPPSNQLVEEESIPDYDAKYFCQVTPGDVVGKGRYAVVSKLGWGLTSTVWLAKDLTSGTHLCLVHDVLRETLEIYRRRFSSGRLPQPLAKAYIKILLVGLDYLHTRCNIVHTDLKLENILITFEDESVLSEEGARLEHTQLHFKENPHRRIFQSVNNFGPLRSHIVAPTIADFGLAQDHSDSEFGVHPIQPDHYRAPEVLLGWGWSYSADIWNLGVMIWNLVGNQDLFTSLHSSEGTYSAAKHLAQMIAILGPPPPVLINERSELKWKWSPAIENDNGLPCQDACSYYSGPFFDSSGAYLFKQIR